MTLYAIGGAPSRLTSTIHKENQMQKFFQSGNAFFVVAVVFLVVSVLTGKFAVYLGIGVVFFILGLAVKKKNSQKTAEPTSKT